MDLPSRHVFKMYLLESFQVPSSTSTDLQSTCNHWNGEPRRRHPSSTHPPPKIYAEQRHLYLANAKKKPPLYIYIYPLLPPSLCPRNKMEIPPSIFRLLLWPNKKKPLGSPNDLDPKVRNMHLQQQLLHGLSPKNGQADSWCQNGM